MKKHFVVMLAGSPDDSENPQPPRPPQPPPTGKRK